MNVYNMKPAWVEVVEETKVKLGRELSGEEVMRIWWETHNFANMLGSMYNRYLNLDKKQADKRVTDDISTVILDGINRSL